VLLLPSFAVGLTCRTTLSGVLLRLG